MCPIEEPLRGPAVRVQGVRAAIARRARVTTISGTRLGRIGQIARWLRQEGSRSIDAVYVEAASSFATPVDILFVAALRSQGIPVGVYFRDAYQLFRTDYPLTKRRHLVLDALWRVTTPLLRRVATARFVPSEGLARALRLRDHVLLPPGVDASLPNLGAGQAKVVGYVGGVGAADGFDLLVQAARRVRQTVPDARLRVVSPAKPPDPIAAEAWIEWRGAGHDDLAAALAEVRVAVIPRPITPYTDLAVPLKLFDYLAVGLPIVATQCEETRRLLEPGGAGVLVGDAPDALAEALVAVLTDDDLASGLAARARALAERPDMSWDARAGTILETLLPDG
jgi:glycosyltransferase involved in cell wall biosynthesis